RGGGGDGLVASSSQLAISAPAARASSTTPSCWCPGPSCASRYSPPVVVTTRTPSGGASAILHTTIGDREPARHDVITPAARSSAARACASTLIYVIAAGSIGSAIAALVTNIETATSCRIIVRVSQRLRSAIHRTCCHLHVTAIRSGSAAPR